MICKRCGTDGLYSSDLCGEYGCVSCYDGTTDNPRKRIDEIIKRYGSYDSRKDREGAYDLGGVV